MASVPRWALTPLYIKTAAQEAPICQDGRSGGFTELLARAEVSHDALIDFPSEKAFTASDEHPSAWRHVEGARATEGQEDGVFPGRVREAESGDESRRPSRPSGDHLHRNDAVDFVVRRSVEDLAPFPVLRGYCHAEADGRSDAQDGEFTTGLSPVSWRGARLAFRQLDCDL